MNWTKIKSFLILLLLSANVFFIIMLSIQYRSNYLLDKTMIDGTLRLMSEDGITIADGAISEKKLFLNIVKSNYGENYAAEVVNRIAGTDKFSSHMMYNGIRYTVRDTGDIFEFPESSVFALKYVRGDIDEREAAAYAPLIEEENPENTFGGTKKKSFAKKLSDFLASSGAEETSSGICVISGSCDSNGVNTVRFVQTMSDCAIYSCGGVAVIDSDGVRYLEGNVIFFDSVDTYTADMYDQINILFMEKAYIDENREAAQLCSEITGVNGAYCINWNASQDIFYLIPAWRIEYSDNTYRIRNAVNGNIYTT